MYKKSIAKNHLSDLASKGRYGDTEIARTSKGELWHVNPQEKALIDMYGMEGEKMVDAMGSGTINPETGLEEKWVQIALGVANLAVAGYGAWKSGSMTRQSANQQSSELQSMDSHITDSIANLADVYSSKKDLLLAEVGNTYRKLGGKYVDAKTKFKRQSSANIGRSDLVASTSTQRSQQTEKDIANQYQFDIEDVMGTTEKELGNLSSWYEGELAQLDLQRKQTTSRLDLAKRTSDSWYLGKGLEDILT